MPLAVSSQTGHNWREKNEFLQVSTETSKMEIKVKKKFTDRTEYLRFMEQL